MFAVIPGSSRFNGGTIMNFSRLGVLCVALAAVMAIAGAAYSQEKNTANDNHGIMRSADLKWTPIIKGCDLAAVNGDSSVEGAPFVLRLRCTAGTKIPAHWHPTEENVTVLQGTFQVGMGEKFDATRLQTMSPGNFVSMPKEMRHFALSKTATIVQVNAIGPFKVNWVDPSEVIPPEAKPAK
jgi:redox-sensitive bicupin YhaK (pirin superfamily)